MVTFIGNITPKNIRKQTKRTTCLAGGSILAICGGVVLFCAILFLTRVFQLEHIQKIAIPTLCAIVVSIILLIVPISDKNDIKGHGVSIEIDETRVRCNRPHHALPFVEISINEVKRVLDYGECYYLIYTSINQAIICQKDLLKQGSLEEFEALFQGKIKRKCKKK
ncbi:MAG: hypothetical protein K2K12_05290 [Clostridia bacterium]|nr:hypothetical protein [Clostridia bacterium]